VVASGITIGFGGSVGAEAPIVLTGSAIGSNLGQIFRMDKKTMILLVGCGASAAIAGIFKAPIAGLVFTLEVLMVDLSMASLLPILISCVTATCFTYILMGSKSLFDFTLTNPWALDRVPACLLLGIFCGLVSLYFMRTMSACEGFFAKLSPYPYVKLLFGGLILSSLIFLFPSLYGEGYSAVNIAIFIGYRLRKVKGSLFATLGVVMPSFVIILTIAMFFHSFKENPVVEKIFKGIRPGVVALIAAPTFNMAKMARINRYTIWIPVVSALLIWLLDVSPIWIIVVAGTGGFLWGKYVKKSI
jgi:H+/Cl- antiporter ClcA